MEFYSTTVPGNERGKKFHQSVSLRKVLTPAHPRAKFLALIFEYTNKNMLGRG
jgi:hypothetical protein